MTTSAPLVCRRCGATAEPPAGAPSATIPCPSCGATIATGHADDPDPREFVERLREQQRRHEEASRKDAKFWAVLFFGVFGALAAYTLYKELHG